VTRPACPASHEEIKRDPVRWAALPLVGRWDMRPDGGELLELRNCSCKSTLAVEIKEEA